MNTRVSRSLKAALSVILSSMFIQGIMTGNYAVSVIVFVFGVTLMGMLGLRAHQVPDEREDAIAGLAAFYTVTVLTVTSVFVSFGLLVSKKEDVLFRVVAFTLAYAASFTIFCFGVAYSFLNQGISPVKRVSYILLALVVTVLFVLYGIHIL